MLPDVQLLTISTDITNYKPKDWSSPARPLPASKLFLLHLNTNVEGTGSMAHHQHSSRRSQNENELWLSMPPSARRQQQQNRSQEQSAYGATSSRMSVCSTSSRTPPSIPIVATSSDLNKPLPPSPLESERKRRTPASLRGLIRREPSSHADPNYLRPQPYPERTSSLSLNTNGQHHHSYSRSMPNSPFAYDAPSTTQNPATLPRAHSSAAGYAETVHYQPYSLPAQPQHPMAPYLQQRSTSMNTYFDPTTPPRSRTFPESSISPTARENVLMRPRPHTWLSPTEPFSDISQFHLFAEATTGLPDDSDAFSPTGPPQLQGSLFARTSRNDTIPIPLQYQPERLPVQPTRSNQRDDWQNFEPPPSISLRSATASTSILPRPEAAQQWQPPPHMSGINRELEILGLDDERGSDDELPDYAQSQAEMNAKKRADASARARELEARWRGTRGI